MLTIKRTTVRLVNSGDKFIFKRERAFYVNNKDNGGGNNGDNHDGNQ